MTAHQWTPTEADLRRMALKNRGPTMARAKRVKEEQPDYDRDAYTRGWNSRNLDNGDARGEPEEWYDGYTDKACGREKWHRPLCQHHHNYEGGCGHA